MSLNLSDVEKIARLSRLSLTDDEKQTVLVELDGIFHLIEEMQSVDTDGVEPLSHPHDYAQRLRDDFITQSDCALQYQACAPQVEDRLYIVPKVIE